MREKLKVFDLFSGIGGFSYGLESTGLYETVGFCEIENKPQQVLRKNWPNVAIFNDVTNLTKNDLEGVDVLCGGFPCQDISIASRTNEGIDGKRSGLWKEYYRLINEVRPSIAIIENVSALRSRGLGDILQDLAYVGYDAAWTVFDTQFFGSPQRRRRFYILAFRDGIKEGCDVFGFGERSNAELSKRIQDFKESRARNSKQGGKVGGRKITTFTRQRSDQYDQLGVASTFAKRDYKSFTDLVYHHEESILRKITPEERLSIHGFPIDFMDGLGLSKSDRYKYCGMSTQVVKHVGKCAYEALYF